MNTVMKVIFDDGVFLDDVENLTDEVITFLLKRGYIVGIQVSEEEFNDEVVENEQNEDH